MSRNYSVKFFKTGNSKSNDRIISYMNQRSDIGNNEMFQKVVKLREKVKKMYFSDREKYWKNKNKIEKTIDKIINSNDFGFDKRKEGIGIETYTYDKTMEEKIKSVFTDEGVKQMTPNEFMIHKQQVLEVLKEFNALTYQHDFLEIHYPQWINRVKERLGVDRTMSVRQFTNYLRKYIL